MKLNDDKIKALPFIYSDGIPSLSDSEIKYLYKRLKEENLLEITFYNMDTKEFLNEDVFLNIYKNPVNKFWIVLYENKIAGITWINNIIDNKAEGHFCYFRDYWGDKAIEMGKFMLKFLVTLKNTNNEYLLDCIIGITPIFNQAAINFITRVGMIPLGEIPSSVWSHKYKTSCSGLYSYFTRGCL